MARVRSATGFANGEEASGGRKYEAALETMGLVGATVRNYASVARSVESSRRRRRLSFSHDEVPATLEPNEPLMPG